MIDSAHPPLSPTQLSRAANPIILMFTREGEKSPTILRTNTPVSRVSHQWQCLPLLQARFRGKQEAGQPALESTVSWAHSCPQGYTRLDKYPQGSRFPLLGPSLLGKGLTLQDAGGPCWQHGPEPFPFWQSTGGSASCRA
jgi:hypothetical protein